jgi:hypothetical protein
MRLLLASLVVLLTLAIVWAVFFVRGVSSSYQKYEHPFWKASDEILWVIPWEQAFFKEKMPNLILFVDVSMNDNEQLLAIPWIDRKTPVKKLPQEISQTRPELNTLLMEHSDLRFAVSVNDNRLDVQTRLIEAISKAQASDRVIIVSDYSSIIKSTKVLNPTWLFSLTTNELVKLQFFDQLQLVHSAQIDGDVLFSELKIRGKSSLSPEMVSELQRRFKKVILGPISSRAELEQAQLLKPNGFFVNDPLLLP